MENQNNNTLLQSVPNSTATLVLGILSIVFCWCYGIIGLTLAIIAIVISKKGKTDYENNPESFTRSSYNNLKAGRICAIIGLSLSAVYVVYILIMFMFYGALLTSMPWQEIIENSRQY